MASSKPVYQSVSQVSKAKPTVDDRELILRAQRGDQAALDALVDLHQRPVTHFIYRYFSNTDDIEDMVQDVFTKAFCKLKQFDPSIGEFRNWLFQIASNASISEKQRRKRRSLRNQQEFQIKEESHQATIEPYVDRVMASRVQTVVQQLPSQERLVLILRFYHDMTQQQIADLIGKPLGTVKSNMRLGIARVRQELQKLQEGDIR